MKCIAKVLILMGLFLIEIAFLPNVSHTEGFIESAVGIWLFEDAGDKVIDSSGTGNNGTFKDGKVNRVKGKVGNGWSSSERASSRFPTPRVYQSPRRSP